jgi:hypothetical protein
MHRRRTRVAAEGHAGIALAAMARFEMARSTLTGSHRPVWVVPARRHQPEPPLAACNREAALAQAWAGGITASLTMAVMWSRRCRGLFKEAFEDRPLFGHK